MKTPVWLLKVAPDGRSVLSVSVTASPSGSVMITVKELSTPTVTLKELVTLIRGLLLAVSKQHIIYIESHSYNILRLHICIQIPKICHILQPCKEI